MSKPTTTSYWNLPAQDLLAEVDSTPDGLSAAEASKRLQQSGPNALKPHRQYTVFRSFIAQFTSPLVLILIFAAAVSMVAGEWTDAVIVIIIVIASAMLSFVQEYRANQAVEKLRAQITTKATILRDGKPQLIPVEDIVTGDVALLSAGSLIPADGIVLEARDFFVNQAVLTG
ncbi:MAG TPA: cation-transporting P-type ATPase, partial [Clostridiaceae bacterium]|nr:cation-transporting P-type ATPase [Clostridiaceae bacterium]